MCQRTLRIDWQRFAPDGSQIDSGSIESVTKPALLAFNGPILGRKDEFDGWRNNV